ncbi:putative cytosol aminopeptidase [Mycolicibacterium sarraceniae]|uniref:Probable cytosol aminopeptidase n=1 Tax=Mycolicibacterium sarraceniae TaxID=1534348 RepID=A0A7I7SMV7_9MYCO|nr:putative cytosol aminopeptidase [Mycolicibacterium sarraceniae]
MNRVLGIDLDEIALAAGGFDATSGTRESVLVAGPDRPVRVTLVGLGRRAGPGELFEAALASGNDRAVISTLALEAPDALGAVAQGHSIGGWRYQRRSDAPATPPAVELVDDSDSIADSVLARAAIVARATGWVRQLVETPPNMLGTKAFADSIVDFARELAPQSVTVEQWDAATLAQHGFGGTLGVGAGSSQPPLAVALKIAGDGAMTALAGKGITFDSGGVNLKRGLGELSWMKSDMAAAAAVAAAVIAAGALDASGPVTAILPIAENMPSGTALRPGDVLTHPGGRTTEVLDTDSEGRIVLADALGYLAAQKPSRLIDVGTLTDSGGVGHCFWGCWTTSTELARDVVSAGERAFDRGWALPLHSSYAALLSSRVADIANSPTAVPDSGQLAATYLRSFVGDVPWVHIDNGSSAWLEEAAHPWPAGATGTPVRALIEFLAPGTSC